MGPVARERRGAEKGVKPGLIPTYRDGDDSRTYRRKVVDWVLYMSAASGSGVMTYRQQFYALVMNVDGNARLRLDSLARRVPSELSEAQFHQIVDILLTILDLIDREVQFLNTSEAWKKLQSWEHRSRQSFEDYWFQFSKLSAEYSELHTTAEGNVAVQELIALTCVHNANLSRSEFTSVLQGAMHWQEASNQQEKDADKALTNVLLHDAMRLGPPTASAAMSRCSPLTIVGQASGVSSNADDVNTSPEDGVDQTVDISESAPTTIQSVMTNMRLHLDDVLRENNFALGRIEIQLSNLTAALQAGAPADDAGLAAVIREVSNALQHARVNLALAGDATKKAQIVVQDIPKLQPTGAISSAGGRSHSALQLSKDVDTQPLLTLDAVRVALRKLDASSEATSRMNAMQSGLSLPMPKPPRGGRDRKRGSRGRGYGTRGGDRQSGRKSQCYVCKETNHRVWDKEDCRLKWEAQLNAIGDNAASRSSAGPSRQQVLATSENPTTLTGTIYHEPPPSGKNISTRILETIVTLHSSLAIQDDNTGDAIIDGGATGTVIGRAALRVLCDKMQLHLRIRSLDECDPQWHAFGMEGNVSRFERIVGSTAIPISCGKGKYKHVKTWVVDGAVPFVIGKATLRQWDAVEAHRQNYLDIRYSKSDRVRLKTYLHSDGHARLPLMPLPRPQQKSESVESAVAEAMMCAITVSRAEMTLDQKIQLLRNVHTKTHLRPKSLRLLLKRNKLWDPALESVIQEIFGSCTVCLRTGDPEPSRKISFGRLHASFNETVYIDIMYWNDSAGQHMILHCVDYAMGFSHLIPIENRRIENMLQLFEREWLHAYGAPMKIVADQELGKDVVKTWMRDRRIHFRAVPARMHNKAAPVERKNRVVKDILERLDADRTYSGISIADRVAKAAFISNVMYGNQVASAFELAKGYTQSIQGTAQILVPKSIRDAQDELNARRALSRLLKSRPAYHRDDLSVGQAVLVLVPGGPRRRGKWVAAKVMEISTDGVVYVAENGHRRAVAVEHIRTIPTNLLARRVVQMELGFSMDKEHEFQSDSDEDTDTDEERRETSETGGSPNSRRVEEAYPAKHVDIRRETESPTVEGGLPASSEVSDPLLYVPPAADAASGSVSVPADGTLDSNANDTEDSDQSGLESNEDGQPENNSGTPVSGSGTGKEGQDGSVPRRSSRLRMPVERYTPITQQSLINPLDRDKIAQEHLQVVLDRLGNVQFMQHEAPEIPEWLYAEAHDRELQQNWASNKIDVPLSALPPDANVIGSHIVYKIKESTDVSQGPRLVLKARICGHGNQDDERDSLRTDAAVASHVCFRIIYCIAMVFGLLLGKLDIRGAYTQSGEAQRRVYVRPPRSLGLWNTFWLLTMSIYGLVSAGRKWQRVSDLVMRQNLDLHIVLGLPQLFHHPADHLSVILAKYVDDILIAARNRRWMDWAFAGIRKAFDVSLAETAPNTLTVNSTTVEQTADHVMLDMRKYLREEVELFSISPPRRKQVSAKLSKAEMRMVRRIAGKLGYLGTAVSPMAAFAASYMQQCIPDMTVAGLKATNGLIRDVMRRDPTITYLRPSEREIKRARVLAFSDAGFPHHGAKRKVAQEGCIIGVGFGDEIGIIFHAIVFVSRKQTRVSQSSGAAETIAAVMSLGYAVEVQKVYAQISGTPLPVTLVVDSKGLHECLATEHTARDPSMSSDVHLLRQYYAEGTISDLVWVPGKRNPADPLTKPHPGATADILYEMINDGRLPIAINDRRGYGAALAEER